MDDVDGTQPATSAVAVAHGSIEAVDNPTAPFRLLRAKPQTLEFGGVEHEPQGLFTQHHSSSAHLYNNHTIDECAGEPAGCGAFLLPNGHEPLEVRLCFASFASFALPLPLLLLLLSAAAAAEKPFEKSFETLTLTPASTTRWQGFGQLDLSGGFFQRQSMHQAAPSPS